MGRYSIEWGEIHGINQLWGRERRLRVGITINADDSRVFVARMGIL